MPSMLSSSIQKPIRKSVNSRFLSEKTKTTFLNPTIRIVVGQSIFQSLSDCKLFSNQDINLLSSQNIHILKNENEKPFKKNEKRIINESQIIINGCIRDEIVHRTIDNPEIIFSKVITNELLKETKNKTFLKLKEIVIPFGNNITQYNTIIQAIHNNGFTNKHSSLYEMNDLTIRIVPINRLCIVFIVNNIQNYCQKFNEMKINYSFIGYNNSVNCDGQLVLLFDNIEIRLTENQRILTYFSELNQQIETETNELRSFKDKGCWSEVWRDLYIKIIGKKQL